MNFNRFFILFVTQIVFFTIRSTGQNRPEIVELKSEFDSNYGLDPELFCGEKYYDEYLVSKGFPFYKSEKPIIGSIVYNNIKNEKVSLIYDLYKQNVLLEFLDSYGNVNRIILNNKKIKSFSLENIDFIKNEYPGISEKYVQIIVEDSISCLLGRSKLYVFDNSISNAVYKYTKEIKTYYIINNGKISSFSNRREFLLLFRKDVRKKLNQFIRKNNIKIKKKNSNHIYQLVTFCNELIKYK